MIDLTALIRDMISDFKKETGFNPDVLILSMTARDQLIKQSSDFYIEESNKLNPEKFMNLNVVIQLHIPGLLVDLSTTKKQLINEEELFNDQKKSN